MNAVLIIFVVIFLTVQNMHTKKYIRKNDGKGPFIYASISALAAAITFVILGGGNLDFTWDTLAYSVGFALSYSLCNICTFCAIQAGSLALTSLFTSYSLIIPSMCAIALFDEPVTKWLIIGTGLMLLSLTLVNLPEKGSGLKVSFKWFWFAFLAFAGNGLCSTVQTIQQRTFDGAYKNEFMIVALLISSAISAISSIVAERGTIIRSIKTGSPLAVANGCINAFVNLFVMMLVMTMNASVVYPLISVGGIVLTGLVSVLVYKEKLSVKQIAGIVTGAGAIVFLNM
ncbi:MAG: hypothetical protein E7394_08375 [Ruminococcaceae bacterium]|nr:hypothetical protein [Oscillospiraceae bacterium]